MHQAFIQMSQLVALRPPIFFYILVFISKLLSALSACEGTYLEKVGKKWVYEKRAQYHLTNGFRFKDTNSAEYVEINGLRTGGGDISYIA